MNPLSDDGAVWSDLFFFQAEDGIRDADVTGVQTCALPISDQAADTDSLRRFAQGYSLTRELLRWYQRNYFRDERDRADWRASPLRAKDHSRLPPAYVITAVLDPLLYEARSYAEPLDQPCVGV